MSDAISPAILSEEELARMRSWEKDGVYLGCGNAVAALLSHIAALEAKLADETPSKKDAQAICDLLRQARELERERCAKIAEEHAGFCSNTAGQAAAEAIAAAIRKGGET